MLCVYAYPLSSSCTLYVLILGSDQLEEGAASMLPETGPSTCSGSTQNGPGVVADGHLAQRDERVTTGENRGVENCADVVEVGEKEQEPHTPLQVVVYTLY